MYILSTSELNKGFLDHRFPSNNPSKFPHPNWTCPKIADKISAGFHGNCETTKYEPLTQKRLLRNREHDALAHDPVKYFSDEISS